MIIFNDLYSYYLISLWSLFYSYLNKNTLLLKHISEGLYISSDDICNPIYSEMLHEYFPSNPKDSYNIFLIYKYLMSFLRIVPLL